MLNIHYFASFREAMNKAHDQLELPQNVSTVAELIEYLQTTDPAFKALLEADSKLLVAVNQTVVGPQQALSADDEVAFFPPMTGG
jgi:sulfur-carrier protein